MTLRSDHQANEAFGARYGNRSLTALDAVVDASDITLPTTCDCSNFDDDLRSTVSQIKDQGNHWWQ